MDQRAIVSDIQEGTTDQQSAVLQQIKCSKSRLLIEEGTILVTLLPIIEDETAYRLCCVLSVIESLSMEQPIAVRVQGMMEELSSYLSMYLICNLQYYQHHH